MLAEINLIPRKDRENQAKKVTILLISVITLLVIITFFVQARLLQEDKELVSSANNELKVDLEQKITTQNQLRQDSSVEILQSAVDYATAVSKDILPYLEEIIDLLPERGYFVTYEQADPQTIEVVIQFDTNREAAYYLSRLKESPTFVKVFLSDLESQIDLTELEQVLQAEKKFVPRVEATYQLEVKSNIRVIENGGENNES